MGYTLVSIGHLDEKGFTITFLSGQCTIRGPDGSQVGAVPKMKGLYQVAHDEHKSSNAIDKELTLDQFHHWMSHLNWNSSQASRKRFCDRCTA